MENHSKFSFGGNWESYAAQSLNAARVGQARRDFGRLFAGVALRGKSFLDIGFGQGLSLMLAVEAGARATGFDLDPQCERALAMTARFFPAASLPPVQVGSILDEALVEALRSRGGFDVVHSWGVLHHTGAMTRALRNAARLVKPQGYLVLAIYNKHWSAPLWWWVKRVFVAGSPLFQKRMLRVCALPMALRVKMLGRGAQPQNRGMEFYHDLRDWLGGYPYEYASRAQVEKILADMGLQCVTWIPTSGWTGCNQYVFRRTS